MPFESMSLTTSWVIYQAILTCDTDIVTNIVDGRRFCVRLFTPILFHIE